MTARRRAGAAATCAIAAVVIAACDGLPGHPTAEDVSVRPDDVKSFAALYSENCAGCHGPEGRGGAGAVGLADPVYLAIADDAVIRHAASAGVRGSLMPAFARTSGGMLTDAQIDVLVRGVRGWEKPDTLVGAAAPPYASGGGDADRGSKVYGKFCESCHGPGGVGGAKAGSIVDGSFLGLVSDQSLRTTVLAGRPDIGQPDWRSDVPGQPMTADDVSDVVAWLAAQRPATPGQPYPQRRKTSP